MDVNRYERLKKNAERAATDKARAEGGLAAAMKTLEEEFGVTTLEAAEELHLDLKEEAEVAEAKFNKAADKFDADWAEYTDAKT